MMMDEPSVLDYVKSKLAFWQKSDLHLPSLEEIKDLQQEQVQSEENEVLLSERISLPVELPAPPSVQQVSTEESLKTGPIISVEDQPRLESFEKKRGFPWLAILSVALALLAQQSLEPGQDRTWVPGAILYGLSGVALVGAFMRKEWQLVPLPSDERDEFSLSFRLDKGLIAILLMALTYVLFAEGIFTPINTIIWLLAVAAFGWTLWDDHPRKGTGWQRLKHFLSHPQWNINLSRWTLFILLAIAIVLFFRYFRINQVPSEMVSDQAEKLLDVNDILGGKLSVFFPRNTGREAFQFYLTAAIILAFKTGLSYLSLKIGTITAGVVTLPYIYLIGKEWGNRRVGFLAVLFAGIAYWPNIISRIGLRFPLYPLFVAPTLYYLFRGLRRRNRNDFIFSGIALGIGLHGYTPVRVLPFVVIAAVLVYLLHRQSQGARREAITGLLILAVVSFVIFLPLFRYAVANPETFNYRTLTRIGTLERPLPGPAGVIFLQNVWNGMAMFFWSDGVVWVNSVPLRPALDVVSAAFFFLGMGLVLFRYLKNRHWIDLFLLLSVPLLMLPSTLSLAFPDENPSLNRTGGAIIPVFIIIALALDGLLTSLKVRLKGKLGSMVAFLVGLVLFLWSANLNYNLVFDQFATSFTNSAWNTSEMGQVMREFIDTIGSPDTAWTVAYPYWVDTRLVGINAGLIPRDTGIWPNQILQTLANPHAKLFLVNPQDEEGLQTLQKIYPQGFLQLHKSKIPGKDFYVFLVPENQGVP